MTQTQLTANEEKLAQALYQAFNSQVALDMAEWVDLVQDDEAAYRVQARLMKLKGQKVGGYKVSLTSQQTQDMFDSKEPLFGAQVAQHFVPSPAKLSLKHDLMDPLAEVELVFKAKETLLPTDSLADLARKTTVAPGVEVPDARFSDWFPSLSKYLVMTDAAVGGYVVYGTERETSDLSMSDLTEVVTTLSHDGQEVAQGSSAEVLGNPLNSLQWLVKKLATQGRELSAGQRVSSGTFLLPPHLTAGEWRASFNHGFSDVTLTVE